MESHPGIFDVERMNYVQQQIEKAVLPFRENTEAAIVASALIRVARILIERYNPESVKQLKLAAVAYLERREVTIEGEEPTIIIPPGVM